LRNQNSLAPEIRFSHHSSVWVLSGFQSSLLTTDHSRLPIALLTSDFFSYIYFYRMKTHPMIKHTRSRIGILTFISLCLMAWTFDTPRLFVVGDSISI